MTRRNRLFFVRIIPDLAVRTRQGLILLVYLVSLLGLPGTVTPADAGWTASGTLMNRVTGAIAALNLPLDIVINEIAWAGTVANSSDEWIELYNNTNAAINLTGWTLQDGGDINIALAGTIPANGYYLLERTDDTTVNDIAADQIYAGAMTNSGETLTLRDAASNVIDTANGNSGAWNAGTSSPVCSMERVNSLLADADGNWAANNNVTRNGSDANDNPVCGTPRNLNSVSPPPTPTATPTDTPASTPTHTATAIPTDTATPMPTNTATATDVPIGYAPLEVVINEVAWAGTVANTSDEWIELYNNTGSQINLTGWTLQDGGDINISMTGTIPANGYYLLERTDDTTVNDIPADQIYAGALTNSGETLTLRDPASNVIDTANSNSGAWNAGTTSPICSMERKDSSLADADVNWATNNNITRNGVDASDNPICGTPRNENSASLPSTPTATAVPTNTPTFTSVPTNTPTFTPIPPTDTATHTPSPSDTPTITPVPTNTPTFTPIPTDTPTFTPIPTNTPISYSPLDIVINEVAWAGTTASSADEWIELHNNTGSPINLTGWTLQDGGDINIALTGTIPANGYYLLERTDDTTVNDISADQIYAGALTNSGETLTLRDAASNVIDTADGNSGTWNAGTSSPVCSMERKDSSLADADANWATNDNINRNGLDASGNPICGTPRNANSASLPPTATPTYTATMTPMDTSTSAPTHTATAIPTNTATSTPTPTAIATNVPIGYAPLDVVINEVAWAGTVANASDEWIELYNNTNSPIDLIGWTLQDGGDINIALAGTIPANGYYLLERTDDTTVNDISADQIYAGAMTNSGETLTLRDAASNVIDTANGNSGAWNAGTSSPVCSMERVNSLLADADGNWAANNNITRNGLDASDNPICGTPKNKNSASLPPTSTATPTRTATSTPTNTATLKPTHTAASTLTRTATSIPTNTLTSTPEDTATSTPTETVTSMPTNTATLIPTHTATSRPTNTATLTPKNTPTKATTVTNIPIGYSPLNVVINEVAWAGTVAGSADEWIELRNNTNAAIDLTGWTLQDEGDINIALTGTIPAHGYFLLERTDDTTVNDIAADQIYAGTMTNSGETLTLRDAASNLIDTANVNSGAWNAGTSSPACSMERLDSLFADADGNWATNDNLTRNGLDAIGSPICGTPKNKNGASLPPTSTATPTSTPTNTATPAHAASLTNTATSTLTQTTASTPSSSTVFVSQGNHDGWVLEFYETSGMGIFMNTTGPFLYVGDNAQDRQLRSFLSFNTSSLPDGAIITKMQMKIKVDGFTGTNMFMPNATHGNLLVDIRQPHFGWKPDLWVNDFQSPANRNDIGILTIAPTPGWYTITLDDLSFPHLDLAGITQLRLRFAQDDNDDRNSDYIRIFSGTAGAADRPQLIVEYYIP